MSLTDGAYGTIYALFIFSNCLSHSPRYAVLITNYSYCVGTRRKSILDRQQLTKCRKILDFDHATNFESRMVAEVNLYWIIYESCSKATVDLPSTQAALQEWKHEWKFLFGQIILTIPAVALEIYLANTL